MATIPAINARAVGRQVTAQTTLDGNSDTFVVNNKLQLLVLENDTGSDITLTIDGDQAGNFLVPGVGNIDLSAGISILVADGTFVRVFIPSIGEYAKDADKQPAITGGSGLKAMLFEL